jgi:hypothetical protein
MGSLASQSLWCHATSFRRCASTVFDHAIQFTVEGCGAPLAHSQAFETLRHQTGLEVKLMVIMYLPRYFEVTEVGNHTASATVESSWLGMA